MPARTKRLKSGKVQVRTPGGVKAKGTTPIKAARQKRLLNAIDHGFKPTGKKAKPMSQATARKILKNKPSKKGRASGKGRSGRSRR